MCVCVCGRRVHSKALWTQAILLTTAWGFAFLSFMMLDEILKYLYAMFACLQVCLLSSALVCSPVQTSPDQS